MKVLGINGSHRAGKGTAALLQAALDGAAEQGTALRVPVGGELEMVDGTTLSHSLAGRHKITF